MDKINPIPFRPKEDVNVWLRRYAIFHGMTINKVLNVAVRAFIRSQPRKELEAMAKIDIDAPADDDDKPLGLERAA